jgi:tetratricopeptide (TPR) repeat protein
MFKWLSGSKVAEVGTSLADSLAMHAVPGSGAPGRNGRGSQNLSLPKLLSKFLQQVDRETAPLKLNIFSRAALANSFKWRLLEKGVERSLVDELTQSLVLRLTVRVRADQEAGAAVAGQKARPRREALEALFAEGTEYSSRGELERALACFQEVSRADPRNLAVLNVVGITLYRLGRYTEAEEQFRRAINIKESHPDAHCHLGGLLRSLGHLPESEQHLRRALKLRPSLLEAQISLGATLFMLGRTAEARAYLEKALRVAPRNVDALMHMGRAVALEGNKEAESWYKRAIEVDPNAWLAWVGLSMMRKFTAADADWLKGAQASAESGLATLNEASVHFAIGKYYDEVGEYDKAFKSFRRAKELVKSTGVTYNGADAEATFKAWIRTYDREALARKYPGASDSEVPVIVTGMPRSGTSLVEQIIASHPAAAGAGELGYWSTAIRNRHSGLVAAPPDESTSRKLAEGYLKALTANSGDAARVVDKSIFNFMYLGAVHAVFPRARLICMRRNPIDTCLSCYFQDFPPSLSFTHDLSDLAHLYRLHHKIVSHWRSVLPPEAFLEVPYEELTADQENWTRRIIEFLGLPWDDRCLQFHSTKRVVATASNWQVRQKIYRSSVERWRHYEKFIGPLLELRDLET